MDVKLSAQLSPTVFRRDSVPNAAPKKAPNPAAIDASPVYSKAMENPVPVKDSAATTEYSMLRGS